MKMKNIKQLIQNINEYSKLKQHCCPPMSDMCFWFCLIKMNANVACLDSCILIFTPWNLAELSVLHSTSLSDLATVTKGDGA